MMMSAIARDQRLSLLAAPALAAAAWKIAARRERRRSARLHRVLVELLLNALSSGDPVTARHSRRVANLADVLATPLGFERREHATLRVAALLHDMGKIEDEVFPIVHSARPLSDEERAMVKHHPSESASILEPLEEFHPGLTRIVASHHECWSGGGYPGGASGETIPVGARIISVADVFDALTQPRAYREPLPVDEALEQIRAGAGKRFDPAIVELLDDPVIRARWTAIALQGRYQEDSAGEPPGDDSPAPRWRPARERRVNAGTA